MRSSRIPFFLVCYVYLLVVWSCGIELSSCVNFDFHCIAGSKKECTRALDAPLNVGHRKVCRALDLITGRRLNFERHRDLVVLPVNSKKPGQFHLRNTLRIDGSFYVLRSKNNLRIFIALQNFLMHFLVASLVVTVAARGVHDDFSARFSRSSVETNMAALQLECSVNGVERGIEREFDCGLRGIQLDC